MITLQYLDLFSSDEQQTLFLTSIPVAAGLVLALVLRFCLRNWHIDAEQSDAVVHHAKRAVLTSTAVFVLTLFALNISVPESLFGFLSVLSWQFDITHSLALVAGSLALFLTLKSYSDPYSLLIILTAAGLGAFTFHFDLPYQAGAAWCLTVGSWLPIVAFLRWRLLPLDPQLPPSDWIQRIYQRGAQFSSLSKVIKDFFRQAYLSAEQLVRVGNQWINVETLTGNLMLPGAPGTGKTILLRLMMQSVLSRIKPGSHQRAIIFDAKREQVSVIAGMGLQAPVIILNPFDQRTAVWDLARDFRTPSDALQLAKLFLPDNQKEADAFWNKTARGLLADIINAHINAMREGSIPHWSLSDLIRSLQSKDEIEKALAMSARTKDALRNIHEDKIYHGVLATLDLVRREFEALGALWDKPSNDPERLFSLTEWVHGSGVIILGPTVTAEAIVNPLNRLILDRVAQLLLDLPDNDQSAGSPKSRTWFFLDEFPRLGRMPRIENLMTNGRSKGVIVVLAFQDISELKDQQLYGEQFANVIVGACTHKVFFQASSHAHAAWCAETLGAEDVEVRSKSYSVTVGSSGTSTTLGHSASEKTRPLITKDEFLYLGKPGQANPIRTFPGWLRYVSSHFIPDALLTFYRTSRYTPIRAIAVIQGKVFPMTMSFMRSVAELMPKVGVDMIPRAEADQFLEGWQQSLPEPEPPKVIETTAVDPTPPAKPAFDLKAALFNIFAPKQKPKSSS